jgi:hypothetical protein
MLGAGQWREFDKGAGAAVGGKLKERMGSTRLLAIPRIAVTLREMPTVGLKKSEPEIDKALECSGS